MYFFVFLLLRIRQTPLCFFFCLELFLHFSRLCGFGSVYFRISYNMFGVNLLFRGLIFDFSVELILFVKNKANSTIELQKCKGSKKRVRFLVSKVRCNIMISQRKKKLIIDLVLSN